MEMKVAVRTVLYTDDFEPITVLELPSWSRDYLERHGVVRLTVTMIEAPARFQQEEPPICQEHRTVDVWSEPFVRNGETYLILFTRNDENALLLKSSFLPGQRRELLDQLADAFAKGFLKAIRELGEK